MKRLFFIAAAALLLVSCGNSYIEEYEAICSDAQEQVEAASSVKEILSIMKQMRSDIRELNEEYPEEAEKYKALNMEDEDINKMYQRRVKASNAVNAKAASMRRKILDAQK